MVLSLWEHALDKYENLLFSKIKLLSIDGCTRVFNAFPEDQNIPLLPNIQEVCIRNCDALSLNEAFAFCYHLFPNLSRISMVYVLLLIGRKISCSSPLIHPWKMPTSLKTLTMMSIPIETFTQLFPALSSYKLDELNFSLCNVSDDHLDLFSNIKTNIIVLESNYISSLSNVLRTFSRYDRLL